MSAQVETEIGTIADDWELVKLGSVCEKPQYGFTASSASEGNAKFLRITDIDDMGVDWTEVPFCACTNIELEKYRLYSGDIVFARIGATTGKSYLIKNPPNAVFASYLIRVRPKSEIDPQFLNYFFHSDAYWRQVNANKNSNLKKGINGSVLNTLLLPQPLLPEQRRIARVLTTVQTAIEHQARLIALTRELKSALMRKLFTEGLPEKRPHRFQKPVRSMKMTEIGPVPESWEVVKLREAVEYIDYGYSAPIPKTAPENGIKIVSTADINRAGEMLYWKIRRTAAPEKTVKRLALVDGDVLFNWRNSAELIGKTTIFEQQPEAHIFASFVLRIRCDEKKTHNYFLKHLLNHYREQGVFVKLSRRAVNQANYNRNEIFELTLPFPKYEEQREIAEMIGAVESKIHLHESKINLLEELFRTLLHQLMTGQTRVKDADLTGF